MVHNLFDTNTEILKNGIKLITIKKDSQLISINAGVKVGALYEAKKEKGICHFIEHMLFKGTNSRSNEELNEELEELGGEYNAYTDYTSTVYTITALKEELEKSLELLSDMLTNSNFPDEEIDKEREVILSEIRSINDDLEDYSYKKIHDIAFKNSSLKYDVTGEVATVKGFRRENLMKFYGEYYVPNNIEIAITSPYEHNEILNLIYKYLGNWARKELKAIEIKTENHRAVKKTSRKKEIEQGTIVYLYTFHNLTKKEELALKILEHKLGSSTNSILFRELRENKGLCYEVFSEMNSTNNIKTLYIYASVSEENIEEALKIIDTCIDRIKNRDIIFHDKIISLMKKVLRTAIASTIEDSTEVGNYMLHQSLDGEPLLEFIDQMKKLDEINEEDIYNVALKVFTKPAIHILVPKEGDEYEDN